MLKNPDYLTARDLLLAAVSPVETEQLPLERAVGRVLGENVAQAGTVLEVFWL